jgi:(1->4)-alpha-D-glucan 1-alpha-D-glucosylmutase
LRPEDQKRLAGTDLSRFAKPAELHALCEDQHWRLAWWRSAGDIINWRRFFDITELAGLRIEDEPVFEAVHALPLRLYGEGLIDGVRVDHIDGLADPAAYCRRLRAALDDAGARRPADASNGPAYIVVEKILAAGERLPPDWGVDGTSGYDFLNDVSALLHDPAAGRPLGRLWHELSGRPADFDTEERAARSTMAERGFAGQLDATARAFARVAASDIATRDIGMPALRRAIAWLLEAFPAYRTYGTGDAAPATDAEIRRQAAHAAIETAGPADADIVRRIDRWLAGEGPGELSLRRDAVRRFQQLSAPIAAKAVEDTAFYRYGRLLSRNDVGCHPGRLGEPPRAFAEAALARGHLFPHAMLATATHDHKRGEDTRMRLAVLSEIPARWAQQARHWAAGAPHQVDCGDAHMLHQAIVGAWPLGLRVDDDEGVGALRERLAQWQWKALREAKLNSSWACPDEGYEAACRDYLDDLMAPGSAFLGEVARFAAEIAPAGWAKSLAQTLLRYTLPGVPDLYQGREGWDLSLVDPDNRRPVDYAQLGDALDRGDESWRSGGEKQALIRALLALRRTSPELFARGELHFHALAGPQASHAIAFERRHGDQRLLVLCAIRCAQACIDRGTPEPSEEWWRGTAILLPEEAPMDAERIAGHRAVGYLML